VENSENKSQDSYSGSAATMLCFVMNHLTSLYLVCLL